MSLDSSERGPGCRRFLPKERGVRMSPSVIGWLSSAPDQWVSSLIIGVDDYMSPSVIGWLSPALTNGWAALGEGYVSSSVIDYFSPAPDQWVSSFRRGVCVLICDWLVFFGPWPMGKQQGKRGRIRPNCCRYNKQLFRKKFSQKFGQINWLPTLHNLPLPPCQG